MKDSSSEKPKLTHGGARANAGRKQGTKDRITIKSLLEAFEQQSGGQRYEDVLFQDFFTARDSGDHGLAIKYHNLILNKLAPTLLHAEVEDGTNTLEDRARAFALALKAVVEEDPTIDPTGINPIDPNGDNND